MHELSEEARAVLALLLAEGYDDQFVFAPPRVWDELRESFPVPETLPTAVSYEEAA